jgi:tetrahydromethanopterin S-methyltransferase subunit D
MNAAAGDDPQALTADELVGGCTHQAAKAGPVGIGNAQIVSQAGLAGLIEGIRPFPGDGHLHVLLILAYG